MSLLWTTIEACFGIHDAKILPQLLKWLRAMSDSCPDAQQKRDLRQYAIETGAAETLQTIDSLWGPSPNSGLYSSEFQRACEYGQTKVIGYFTDTDIGAHPGWTKKRKARLTYGLRVTAEHGWFVASRYLVSQDADVNGQYDLQGMYVGTALDAAVYHNRLNVVILLLDSGACVQVDEESSYGEETMSAARE